MLCREPKCIPGQRKRQQCCDCYTGLLTTTALITCTRKTAPVVKKNYSAMPTTIFLYIPNCTTSILVQSRGFGWFAFAPCFDSMLIYKPGMITLTELEHPTLCTKNSLSTAFVSLEPASRSSLWPDRPPPPETQDMCRRLPPERPATR